LLEHVSATSRDSHFGINTPVGCAGLSDDAVLSRKRFFSVFFSRRLICDISCIFWGIASIRTTRRVKEMIL
jgi:hypothetical protein